MEWFGIFSHPASTEETSKREKYRQRRIILLQFWWEFQPNSPIHLWCRLLPQAELTLNLLRQSRTTPNVSANAHVQGTHNFMKRPLEPLGCDVQAHEKSDKRITWDPHSCDGWNFGTSMDHHRCFTVWIKKTRAERITDTVFLNHKYLTNPK